MWLASSEARFLKGKFVWANRDAQEPLERAEEVRDSMLLNRFSTECQCRGFECTSKTYILEVVRG